MVYATAFSGLIKSTLMTKTTKQTDFAERLLRWFDQHGRKDLPWQHPRTAYRVWVSEIMLQQTQVVTVMDYFLRFMQRFPDLATLAAATEDDVLHYWSGLGYYARCRNLHKTARILREQGATDLPDSREQLEQLPGIGRSTAAAIVAQVWNQPEAILDGNVKRVLARYLCIEGWTGSSAVLKQLWSEAEKLMPRQRVADYTQAIMDFGATVCMRSRPACEQCSLAMDCQALANDLVTALPTPKKKKALPEKHSRFLIIRNADGHILLEKRPPTGIWGGLWSLPELNLDDDVDDYCQQHGFSLVQTEERSVIKHSFSHYHLFITPTLLGCVPQNATIAEQQNWHWYRTEELAAGASSQSLGLPAPVSKILASLSD